MTLRGQTDKEMRSIVLLEFSKVLNGLREGEKLKGERKVFLQVSKSHSFSQGLQGSAHTTENLTNEATIPDKPPENSQASTL